MLPRLFFFFLLLFAFSLPLLWPGDAPFIGDESQLMLMAFDANQHHHLANQGLYGTVGLPMVPAGMDLSGFPESDRRSRTLGFIARVLYAYCHCGRVVSAGAGIKSMEVVYSAGSFFALYLVLLPSSMG